ncbi:hypothetical protein XSR1_180084 [Xenorhabdus szentirmaii DSM 16338]|uniref:Uncharacterized protein n=1 Tax=Xenorhabdus szentirmaii DSM 16338 TaxID=1427518 RepID=W1IW54_9GAMM|nr:hypothetical protein XSR1_180084 [Xenorhabdus szentirmaii DSM 16338]
MLIFCKTNHVNPICTFRYAFFVTMRSYDNVIELVHKTNSIFNFEVSNIYKNI